MFSVDPWLAEVFAFEVADGDQLDEIFPAGFIFCQQRQVSRVPAAGYLLFIVQGCWGEVDLTAEDGFDTGLGGGLVEFHSGIEVPMVSYGHCGHFEFGSPGYELLGSDSGIKGGVFRVDVKVDK